MTPRIMTIYGTRPEAIKVAPVVQAIERSDLFSGVTVVTGQHREMLDQVNRAFGIEPDHDLDLMSHGQPLSQMFARVLESVDEVIAREHPDLVVVQGDTTTSTAGALAAFHRGVPVAHLEAGLRTGDLSSPFPEEANRRITTQLTALHLAPTSVSRENLLREGVPAARVVVTGNTVVDALLTVVNRPRPSGSPDLDHVWSSGGDVLVVTTHRRESWGSPMRGVGRAVAQLASSRSDLTVVLPIHRNPQVRGDLLPSVRGLDNVIVTEPLDYITFSHLLDRAKVVLTDSGGVQEEAPGLGKPVLVLRDNTERPEAVLAGTVRLVGTEPDRIVTEVGTLLDDESAYRRMARASNPYGDGRAAERTMAAIAEFFGVGRRVAEFAPST